MPPVCAPPLSTWMPKRADPCANGPSRSPSLSLSVAVKSSSMVIVPLLITLAERLGLTRNPVALFAPLIAIVPALATLLLESTVTAAPALGLTDPAAVIWIPPATLVFCGVVTAVLITVSAAAGDVISAERAPRPVEAKRKRIVIQTPFVGGTNHRFRAC